jgi:hypothetical protein
MRGGLFQSPKLIAMARRLHESREFRDWLLPGGGGQMNGQLISDGALRCVTGALLTVLWSWSREFGKQCGDDCFLPFIRVSDLDNIAGAPGVGEAMEIVGWAKGETDPVGVCLPNFFDSHNVPITAAERQRAYRERKKTEQRVTPALHARVTNALPEKRREESKEKHIKRKPPTPFSAPSIEEVTAYCQERGNTVNPQVFVDYYQARGWKLTSGLAMKDWRAAVRSTWEHSRYNDEQASRVATAEDAKDWVP